jgi:hypothetical protein
MIRWNDKQLAAAGINKRRLLAVVRRLRKSAREMQAMGLCLHFDRTGDACLVHETRPPFAEHETRDHGAAVAWIGRGLEGGHW